METVVWEIIKAFEYTLKSESEFYLKFQSLSSEQKEVLSAFYPSISELDIFEQICKFWGVN